MPRAPFRTIAADAPAKINLTLEVLGRRPDGYHDIVSLAIGVGLCDRMAGAAPCIGGLTFDCSDPTLHGDRNLACQAAVALSRKYGCDAGISLRLQKCIPVGGGLGGGSSDAAAALRICNELWDAGLDHAALAEIGADLGSDVPLFFHLPSALMTGRGERAETFPIRWRGWALLAFPGLHIPTADVYREWRNDDRTHPADSPHDRLAHIAESRTADELHAMMFNELEPAVFRVCPKLAEARDALTAVGLSSTRVTGSGSTLFRLYDDPVQAREAACRIERHHARIRTAVVPAPTRMTPLEQEE